MTAGVGTGTHSIQWCRVLTGGTTTCDVFSGADYYGKLSVVPHPIPYTLYPTY